MKTVVTLSAVAALTLTAGVAFAFQAPASETPAAAAKPQRSCFFASQINGWGAERDEKTAYLYVGAKDVYKAELFSRCMDLDSALAIGVETRGGGSSICDGLDADLLVRSTMGPQRCHITKITKMTPDEVAAMKASKKTKKAGKSGD